MRFAYQFAGACALACLSAAASAQGWIAGVAIGQATQQDYDVGGEIAARDDTDDSMRIFGGFLVSPMQGVIVSWIDLGTAYYDGPAFGGFVDSLDAEGYDISYIAGWAPGSQSRFALFGTVGVFAWDQDVVYADLSGISLYQDEGTSFSMGVGTEIQLGANFGVHLEYQLFKDVGDDGLGGSGHEYDRDVVSVGVSYRFGRPRE
jgi:opacity protein-like surface antigen